MISTIYLYQSNYWDLIRALREDYPLSFTSVSWKMLDSFGFTIRETTARLSKTDEFGITLIALDFRDTPKATMFQLRYSEYIGKAVALENHV